MYLVQVHDSLTDRYNHENKKILKYYLLIIFIEEINWRHKNEGL